MSVSYHVYITIPADGETKVFGEGGVTWTASFTRTRVLDGSQYFDCTLSLHQDGIAESNATHELTNVRLYWDDKGQRISDEGGWKLEKPQYKSKSWKLERSSQQHDVKAGDTIKLVITAEKVEVIRL